MQVEYKCYVMPWVIVFLSLGVKTVALLPKKNIIIFKGNKKNYGPVRTLLFQIGSPVAVLVVIILCGCVPNILNINF